MKFTFITGNEHKARYVAQWLGADVPHHKLDLDELQTLDIRKLLDHKVKQAYDILKTPVLVEDVQLVCEALGGLPGPFVKFFVESIGPEGIAKMLDGFENRTAYVSICYALYDGHEVHYFEGGMHGRIANEARGEGGFGFEKIFINDGFDVARGEMNKEDYERTSHRKLALDKLKEYIANT